jgi:WD40 repeat protein
MNKTLTTAIVRICDPRGVPAGTGFTVTTSDKDTPFVIITCAHVVEAVRAQPDSPVEIAYQADLAPQQATVAGWSPVVEHDIAILIPAAAPLEVVKPLSLGPSSYSAGHHFVTFGYPGIGNQVESHARGSILGQIDSGRRLQISSTDLTRGFSGAPIFDCVIQRVVGAMREFPVTEDVRGGMPDLRAGDEFGRQQDMNYAIPSEILQEIWPPLRLSEICPYKGLHSFTEDDAGYFFGREPLIDQLLSQLKQSPRFLAVVGASGSGKSSLVAAGLFPALRQGRLPGSEHWHLLPFRSGRDPYTALAQSELAVGQDGDLQVAVRAFLARHPEVTRLVLFADQFEELFVDRSLASSGRFLEKLEALLRSDLPLTFMFAIRSDYYHYLLDTDYLLNRLKSGQVVIRPVNKEVLPAMIASPAEKVGLSFDPPATVEQIAADAARIGHPLPLLESALKRLWERRENGTMTLAAYLAIGRVTGAITRWADDTYDALDPVEQKTAQRVFTKLVRVGQNNEPDARQSQTLKQLVIDPDDKAELEATRQVVKKLADAALLVTGDEQRQERVEIIHDALLTAWGRLKNWIEAEREFFLWRRRLDERVQVWQEGNGEQLHDAALAEAEGWLKKKRDDLNTEQRRFISESIQARNRRETRRRRKNQLLVAVATIASVLAILAILFWLQAEQRRQEAAQLATAALAQRALNDNNTDLAIALALEANRDQPSPLAARQALVNAAYYAAGASMSLEGHTEPVAAVAYSPDGARVISASADDTLILWDLTQGSQIGRLEGHTDDVLSVAFSPDGQTILSGSADDTLILWDATSRTPLHTYTGHSGDVTSVAFSPNGQTILSGSADTSLRLWDVAAARQLRVFEGHHDPVSKVAFNRDGQTIISGDKGNQLCKWQVATGTQLNCIQNAAGHGIFSFAITPDQHTVIVGDGGYGPGIHIWDIDSNRPIASLSGHTGGHTRVALSQDGRYLVSGTYDNSLILWDLSRRLILHRLLGHQADVTAVAISPDERLILSGSADHTLRLWEIFRDGAETYRIPDSLGLAVSPDGRWFASWREVGQVGPVVVRDAESGRDVYETPEAIAGLQSLSFSPAGDILFIGDWSGSIWRWDLDSNTLQPFDRLHPGRVTSIAISQDGRLGLSGSYYRAADPAQPDDYRLISWDTATGRLLASYQGHQSHIRSVALSADGQTALSASDDGTACVWSVETGQKIVCFEGHFEGVNHVIFNPDQTAALTASKDETIRLWDIATGREIRRFGGHTAAVLGLSVSPDDHTLASGSADGSIRLWNIATGAEIGRITRGYGQVKNVFFGSDPHTLFSRADDRAVHRWEIVIPEDSENKDWVRWTCDHRYVRPLTCDERSVYDLELQCESGQPPPPNVCGSGTS